MRCEAICQRSSVCLVPIPGLSTALIFGQDFSDSLSNSLRFRCQISTYHLLPSLHVGVKDRNNFSLSFPRLMVWFSVIPRCLHILLCSFLEPGNGLHKGSTVWHPCSQAAASGGQPASWVGLLFKSPGDQLDFLKAKRLRTELWLTLILSVLRLEI